MAEYQGTDFESELVIGLVSATGTESGQVVDLLKEQLERAGYNVLKIKISKDVIPLLRTVRDSNDHYKRVSALMDAGNGARKKSKDDSILALGAATLIAAHRKKVASDARVLHRTAIIIDSLKRPEEVQQLRGIYPSGFVLMGIHAEERRRLRHLTVDLAMSIEEANDLIDRDSEEERIPHGQRVNATFHLADFFVRISESRDRLRCDIKRMVELWFGNPFIHAHLRRACDVSGFFSSFAVR